MSDNCSSLAPWAYRPAFTDNSWIADAFARDTETLTRAMQISLSKDSSNSYSAGDPSLLVTPQPAVSGSASASASDTETLPRRVRNPVPASSSGKILKRKSRASKRSPTTYITADPANFRQMVQQVTGIRFSGSHLSTEPVLKPEPQRPGNRIVLPQSCLPTLDTSAILLDRARRAPSPGVDQDSFAPLVERPGFDFEPFACFSTLESWEGVI